MSLHRVIKSMGTVVTFDVVDDLDPAALEPALDWLVWMEDTFSTFRPTSEVSRIQRGELDPAKSHPLVQEVLDSCDDLFVRSNGVFDPHAKGRLDPSGLGKGWAIERTAILLEDSGAANFTINAGGDIAVRGRQSDGTPWRTGIRHPDAESVIVKVIEHGRTPAAIATSGLYERGAHVIDPRKGAAAGGCRSATVLGTDLTWADAYATIVLILGIDGLGWLHDQPGEHRAYVILDDGTAVSTLLSEDELRPDER